MLLAVLLLILACLPQPAAAQKKPVTLQSLKARESFPEVIWSPAGGRFAWIEKGALWAYEAATGRKRELLSTARLEEKAVPVPAPETFPWENRRVKEAPFQWSDSGREILIPAKGDLFLLHLDTGGFDQLTATPVAERDAKLAPGGRLLSFRREHDLYSMEIASRRVTRLTHDGSATLLNGELDWVYPEELDLGTAHWWSPDGARIAFLQFDVAREPLYPHADLLAFPARAEPQRFPQPGTPNAEVRVGIVAAAGGPVRWLDLGDTRDSLLARVDWSPQGLLAVERLNRIQNRLELHLDDKIVLREEDPYWINVNDVFRFVDGGSHFLWGSERDGHLHLYLYNLDGRLERRLTHGDWDVDSVEAVDGKAREVYYTSTETSPLERQFYRIGVSGKGKRRLTSSTGTHAISMSPACDYYLDTASSLATPPRRTLHNRASVQIAVERDSPPQEFELLPTEIVRLAAADGTPLYARLIRPAGTGKFPAIVMVYGGPHAQTVRDTWAGPAWDQVLARRGFVIWQLDNRGSGGRGHAFEAKVFRNLGALELEDQKRGIQHLLSMGFVDPQRIAIHGWSYGGYMTLYALANAPGLFRAGIAGAPVTDWRNYDSIYTERYMGQPAENPEGYRRSSPLTRAGEITAPLMLVHNFEDDNVHFQNTLQMADALERTGRRFEMLVYPQKAHGVTGPVRGHMLEAMTAFFERTLKP